MRISPESRLFKIFETGTTAGYCAKSVRVLPAGGRRYWTTRHFGILIPVARYGVGCSVIDTYLVGILLQASTTANDRLDL
jgi:hypothetical protein